MIVWAAPSPCYTRSNRLHIAPWSRLSSRHNRHIAHTPSEVAVWNPGLAQTGRLRRGKTSRRQRQANRYPLGTCDCKQKIRRWSGNDGFHIFSHLPLPSNKRYFTNQPIPSSCTALTPVTPPMSPYLVFRHPSWPHD